MCCLRQGRKQKLWSTEFPTSIELAMDAHCDAGDDEIRGRGPGWHSMTSR
jgi:hypothetical protein